MHSNHFGKAVIPTTTAYSRSQLSPDLDELPDNAEALTSVQAATMTSGAIGYRKFNIIEGYKIMSIIAMSDNSHPPFCASVLNDKMWRSELLQMQIMARLTWQVSSRTKI